MIVYRQTFVVKYGSRNKMAEILQDMWKLHDQPPTHRIYQPLTGEREVIQQEIEFEDYAALEEFWANAFSIPGMDALHDKWAEFRGQGETTELLRLVE